MKEPQTPETIQANLSEDQIFVQGGHDVEKERAAFREIARKYLENEAFKGGLEIGEEIARRKKSLKEKREAAMREIVVRHPKTGEPFRPKDFETSKTKLPDWF